MHAVRCNLNGLKKKAPPGAAGPGRLRGRDPNRNTPILLTYLQLFHVTRCTGAQPTIGAVCIFHKQKGPTQLSRGGASRRIKPGGENLWRANDDRVLDLPDTRHAQPNFGAFVFEVSSKERAR